MSMNLKTLRELKGLSRKELADLTDVSFRSIQDYEQGHKDLASAKAETILKMSNALDCSMEDLISPVDLSALKPSEIHDITSGEKDRSMVSSLEAAPMGFNLNPSDELPYILMHKDDRVAAVVLEPVTGSIITISQVFIRELLPVGTDGPDAGLKAWWQRRAVPITQGNISKVLDHIGFLTPQAYLVRTLGLSMTDCYWLKPANTAYTWKEVSLFRNDFDDVVGASQFAGIDTMIDFRNFDVRFPSASTRGDVPKAWICVDGGRRYLVKGSRNGSTQQIFNEVVAAYIHRKQSKFDFVDYQFYTIDYGHGKQLGVSSEAFTSEELEFIPARDLLISAKKPGVTDYDSFVEACVEGGLEREEVTAFMDYMLLTDFVITNTDRSYENFGVLRDSNTLRYVKMAPIFDSGNSMFYDLDMTRGSLELKNIPVDSFAANEAGLLLLVKDPPMVDLDKLLTDEELTQVLMSSNRTPEEIKILVTIFNRKKNLLFKLTKGDTEWMK